MHSCSAKFLQRIGRYDSPSCHCSSQTERTPHHIFLEYPSFTHHLPIPAINSLVSEWLIWLRHSSDIIQIFWKMENPTLGEQLLLIIENLPNGYHRKARSFSRRHCPIYPTHRISGKTIINYPHPTLQYISPT